MWHDMTIFHLYQYWTNIEPYKSFIPTLDQYGFRMNFSSKMSQYTRIRVRVEKLKNSYVVPSLLSGYYRAVYTRVNTLRNPRLNWAIYTATVCTKSSFAAYLSRERAFCAVYTSSSRLTQSAAYFPLYKRPLYIFVLPTGHYAGTLIMAMTAKFFVMISFDAVYVYTAELFPTVVRSAESSRNPSHIWPSWEWPMSKFPCSLTRNLTVWRTWLCIACSDERGLYYTDSCCITRRISFWNLGEYTFWA